MESKKDILKTVTRYAQAGDWPKVIKEYEKLLQLEPNDINLLNSMADALSKTGENRKAFEIYIKILDDYQKKGNTSKIPFLYKKIAKLNPRKFDLDGKALFDKITRIVEAVDFFNKDDLTRAVPALKEAVKLDSANVDLYVKLGEACEKQMLIGEGAEAYTKAMRLYIEKRSSQEAIDMAKKILNLDKSNTEAMSMMAEELIRKGKRTEAEDMYKEILISAAEKGASTEGREIAKRAMEQGIEYGKQFYAYFLFKENKTDEAKKILEGSYDLTPEEKVLLGKIYFKSAEYEKGKNVLLSLDPEIVNGSEEILEQIGDTYLKMREDKKSGEYYFKAAKLLSEGGQLDAAITLCHKVLNVNDSDPEVFEILALIYSKKNMKNQLIDTYEKLAKAYDRAGNAEEASKARQTLAKLKML
ncbi:MAG TPA: tetratricopeptide repeat protein [bacterium]|nr:tetratricopeptide repeat protein [bacterium]